MASGCASGAPSGGRAPARIFERFSAPTIREQPLVHRNSARVRTAIRRAVRAVALRADRRGRRRRARAQDGVLRQAQRRQPRDPVARRGVRAHSCRRRSCRRIWSRCRATMETFCPAWRVVFGASYWESRFEDDVVQAFADSLQKSLSDPREPCHRVADSHLRRHVQRRRAVHAAVQRLDQAVRRHRHRRARGERGRKADQGHVRRAVARRYRGGTLCHRRRDRAARVALRHRGERARRSAERISIDAGARSAPPTFSAIVAERPDGTDASGSSGEARERSMVR